MRMNKYFNTDYSAMNLHSLREAFRGFKFKRSREKSRTFVTFLSVLVIFGATSVASSSQLDSQDGCDWTGSGFDLGPDDSAGIRPVRLRCDAGSVEWSYPRGALRITLTTNNNNAVNTEFQACIKARETFDGARVYVDDGSSLHPLYLAGDGRDRRLPRCTPSVGGTVVLYVESDGERREFKRRVAGFDYDITPVAKNVVDPYEECRPCDDNELLKAYCSSDYVVRGKILRVADEPDVDRSEIVVSTTKTFRIGSLDTAVSARTKRDVTRVYAPLRCRVKAGPGEYVFAGRRRLGDPWLTCAATMSHWVKLVRAATKAKTAPCVLDA